MRFRNGFNYDTDQTAGVGPLFAPTKLWPNNICATNATSMLWSSGMPVLACRLPTEWPTDADFDTIFRLPIRDERHR